MGLNTQAIGGDDAIVEIDESKFGKRKYHRVKRVERCWRRRTHTRASPFLRDHSTKTDQEICGSWINRVVGRVRKFLVCNEAEEYKTEIQF